MSQSSPDPGCPGQVAAFPTTHWSVVLKAGEESNAAAASAMEALCRSYWYPLYAYVRRKGHTPGDAEDLTQGFFARLLQKNFLSTVDQRKGKFRSFLLASLEHFLAKEWNRAHRVKRGGLCQFISMDQFDGEERYRLEPRDNRTPEALYDRSWALAVLSTTMTRLQEEYEREGKGEVFAALKAFLSGDPDEQRYEDIGSRLGLSYGAARVAVHRLRTKYGEVLRDVVAQTVATREEVDEELKQLLAALAD